MAAAITVTVTASARCQHLVQYQTVTRNLRQHGARMTVELVDEIHAVALVNEAQCCRDALLS